MVISQLRKANLQPAMLTFFLQKQFPCIENYNIDLQQPYDQFFSYKYHII
jgi:hypothetical protein